MSVILDTRNINGGFWGTMGKNAADVWPVAFAAIRTATGADPEAVRAFLDSRYGRHFADEVKDAMYCGYSIADAVANTTAHWMNWKIGKNTSCAMDIPIGLPYLTGLVIHEWIIAETVGESISSQEEVSTNWLSAMR